MSELDPTLDELYAAAPEDFVAARNALAKRLRAEKRREDATEVSAHRRPSRPAWALNQLALSGDPSLEALLDAVEAVREPPDGDLRAAIEGLREAVSDASTAAAKVSGLAAGDLAAALHATVADGEALAALTRGRLTEVPAAGASGFGVTLPAAPPPRKRRKATLTAVPDLEPEPDAEPEVDPEVRRQADAALARATEEFQGAAAARGDAEAAVDAARTAVDEAQAALDAAEATLAEARDREAAAEGARAEAENQLPG